MQSKEEVSYITELLLQKDIHEHKCPLPDPALRLKNKKMIAAYGSIKKSVDSYKLGQNNTTYSKNQNTIVYKHKRFC